MVELLVLVEADQMVSGVCDSLVVALKKKEDEPCFVGNAMRLHRVTNEQQSSK